MGGVKLSVQSCLASPSGSSIAEHLIQAVLFSGLEPLRSLRKSEGAEKGQGEGGRWQVYDR